MKKRIKNISGATKLIAGLKVPNNGTIDLTLRQINRFLTASMFTNSILEFVGDIPSQVSIGPSYVTTGTIANSAVTKAKLGGDIHLVEFPGIPNIGVIRIATNVADTETIKIGTTVFEFDTDATPDITEGNVRVDVTGGVTPADATPALITAINAAETGVTAVKISDNEIILISTGEVDLEEGMNGANNVVDSPSTRGGADPGVRKFVSTSRVPNATEVALGNLHIPLNFVPTTILVQVRTTASGIIAGWNGAVKITGGNNPYITLDNSGDTDWAETSTISIIAYE